MSCCRAVGDEIPDDEEVACFAALVLALAAGARAAEWAGEEAAGEDPIPAVQRVRARVRRHQISTSAVPTRMSPIDSPTQRPTMPQPTTKQRR